VRSLGADRQVSNPTEANSLGFTASLNEFSANEALPAEVRSPNRLLQFFEAREQGLGIWKNVHYFDIYDRHFSRFRGQEVHVLEIGIYSGGSLQMWQDYFGPKCHVYGVDISPRCKAHERDGVKIFIGNQSDRCFWADFREAVPCLDIVIDDGSHQAADQAASIEELLPHLSRGGVYLVEDLTASDQQMNAGASYVHGLAHKLNGRAGAVRHDDQPKRFVVIEPNTFQRAIASVHLYPFVAVIERNATDVAEFVSSKQGTVWEPPQFWNAAIQARRS
jgi:SAM-dependent methyltransferase